MVYFRKNYNFPRFQRESNIFHGGPTFSREVQMLISIETHITCDFPGGVLTPYPLLWIWACLCVLASFPEHMLLAYTKYGFR